jgi:FixJ family two-component response regulator
MPDTALISIIDDDAWSRGGIRDLVLSLGYRAEAFASAEQFEESGRINDTSCVISDLQMPGLSGLDLQDRLQAQGHRTPIIFVTAYPDEKHRRRALSSGAAGFLSKPFEEGALIQCLEAALRPVIHA